MSTSHPQVQRKKSHRFYDIKILQVLDLFGNEPVDNRLAINFAFGECGQNCGIHVRRPLFVQRDGDRRRNFIYDNRLCL